MVDHLLRLTATDMHLDETSEGFFRVRDSLKTLKETSATIDAVCYTAPKYSKLSCLTASLCALVRNPYSPRTISLLATIMFDVVGDVSDHRM